MNLSGNWWQDMATAWAIFGGMVLLALGLSDSRLGWPLKWAETFYHELSHGLVARLTGGRIVKIALRLNGSGTCTTQGGWRVPVLLAGYAGAALWGGALYMGGWLLGAEGVTVWLELELAALLLALLLWGRDVVTWLILLIIATVYAAALLLPERIFLPLVLQFIGVYVLLNAIRAPLFLIDGKHEGDGAALADIFLILPEIVWIGLWWLFALGVLGACVWATLPLPPVLTEWAVNLLPFLGD